MQVVIFTAEFAGAPPPVMAARYLASSVPSMLQQGLPSTEESAGVLGFCMWPRMAETPLFGSDRVRGSRRPLVFSQLLLMGSVMY